MDLEAKVREVKLECLKLCVHAGVGHVTSAFSCAEAVTLLYYEVMRVGREDRARGVNDHFIMSKNHASVVTYPILADLGFTTREEIETFLDDGSVFGEHSKLGTPGTDFAGGALGIGIGVACGMAYIDKAEGSPRLTFCMVGDGECYEGSVWEAAMFAGANALSNLVLVVDRNRMTVTDFTDNMLTQSPMADKFAAFGFETREVEDGHDFGQLRAAFADVRTRCDERPLCVIINTVKGHGVDFMENNPLYHGVAPTGELAERALAQVGGGGELL